MIFHFLACGRGGAGGREGGREGLEGGSAVLIC